ncbi:MAG TPA: TatD family hydrolase [Candidatus Paceibacterota bacterium]
MKYIDIHCHLQFTDYDIDREDVISRIERENIGVINVGTDMSTSQGAVELAEKYKNMWATVGIHPSSSKEVFDMKVLNNMASRPKVVAIGECGLDYFRSEPEDFEKQREVFLQHIDLANKVNKPLMLHVRNGKDNPHVYREAISILKKHAKVRANFHFFAGTVEDLKNILDINGTVSFTGVVTFVRSYDEIVKYSPKDRIMSETDAPFVSPIPYRGKRNEPLFIKEITHTLAEIRGESKESFLSQLIDNAKNIFSI